MLLNVSTEYKSNVLQAHFSAIMDELGSLANGNELTADDLSEVFAMGIAAVIETDTNLSTPRDFEAAANHTRAVIVQRAQEFRELSQQAGASVLQLLFSGAPVGAAARS